MKRAAVFLAMVFVGMGSQPLSADLLPTDEQAQMVCDKFLDRVIADDLNSAIRFIKLYLLPPEKGWEEWQREWLEERAKLRGRLGTPQGIELRRRIGIEDLYLQFWYLERLERGGVRWVFTLYHTTDGWILESIIFDTYISPMFKDLG